jgi:hypothetical protein
MKNLNSHQTPGFLLENHSRIAQVVKDAMILTSKIGQRYLWVDSLCIVQDSPEKLSTISKMDLVYQNSLLTFVAATGEHADVGLPGVRPHSRAEEQRCAVLGEHLRLIVPHSLRALENTTWASRAWT